HIGSPLLDERILFGAHLVLVLVLKRPIAPLQRLALFQGRFPWGFECTGDEPVRGIDRLIPALRSLPVILRWLELQSPCSRAAVRSRPTACQARTARSTLAGVTARRKSAVTASSTPLALMH